MSYRAVIIKNDKFEFLDLYDVHNHVDAVYAAKKRFHSKLIEVVYFRVGTGMETIWGEET